jgi:drug/metabolite transporter (DMT)-like permease
MNWFILAILAGAASNFFNIFNRSSLKEKGDSSVYAWWFEVFRFTIFLCLFLINPILPKAPIAYLWLFLFGLTEVASVYYFMKSHQLTDLSLSTFVIKLQLIWTPIVAFLFIGERLALSDYGGIGVILIGIFIAVYSKGMKKSADLAVTPLVIMSMSAPSIFVFPMIMKQSKKRLLGISKKNLRKNMLGVIANVISMYLAVTAVRLGSTSKVSAVFQGMMVISLAYSIIVLKERKQVWKKIRGMIVIIVGLSLLAM